MLMYRDTAGQERYHSLAPMYYRGAAAAIVVFDITHPSSFERAKKWVGELRQNVANPELIIALVGNKADLADQRSVQEADAQQYAEDSSLLYFETSAKDNLNVSELFDTIASKIPRHTAEPAATPGISLGETPASARPASRTSCCNV